MRKFVDVVKIHIFSGKGGDGCNSRYRDKYLRQGKPDGGDGGKGGDVTLVADRNVQTLLDFLFHSQYSAKKGLNGGSKNKKGKNGEPLVLRVPQGTVVKDVQTNEIIADIIEEGQALTVAEGGRGGTGNARMRCATKGEQGVERFLILELHLIADIGIIGFPNAGKSSLISTLSNAKPKIADFPFTTLSPVLGKMGFTDHLQLTIAEIPGIIEEAHKGKGLGLDFLRHALRTKMLVHLLDISNNPFDHYCILNREIKHYGKGLDKIPQIAVANKMDLQRSEENLKVLKKKIADVLPISCVTGEGIEELKNRIKQVYEKKISS